MDGLLVDSEILWRRAETTLLAQHGQSYDEEVANRHMGMRIDEACEIMIQAYGLPLEPVAFSEQIVEELLAEFERGLARMPGAEAMMAQAAAFDGPVAIASSSPMRVVRFVVELFGWGPRVDVLCAGSEVARGKPAPDVFLLAAERMGLRPAQCLVFEDSVNGARAARAAGMRCVAVPDPAFHAPEAFEGIADLVLPSLEGVELSACWPAAVTEG